MSNQLQFEVVFFKNFQYKPFDIQFLYDIYYSIDNYFFKTPILYAINHFSILFHILILTFIYFYPLFSNLKRYIMFCSIKVINKNNFLLKKVLYSKQKEYYITLNKIVK